MRNSLPVSSCSASISTSWAPTFWPSISKSWPSRSSLSINFYVPSLYSHNWKKSSWRDIIGCTPYTTDIKQKFQNCSKETFKDKCSRDGPQSYCSEKKLPNVANIPSHAPSQLCTQTYRPCCPAGGIFVRLSTLSLFKPTWRCALCCVLNRLVHVFPVWKILIWQSSKNE